MEHPGLKEDAQRHVMVIVPGQYVPRAGDLPTPKGRAGNGSRQAGAANSSGGRTPGGIGLFESAGGPGQDVLNEMHLISRSRTKSTALRGRRRPRGCWRSQPVKLHNPQDGVCRKSDSPFGMMLQNQAATWEAADSNSSEFALLNSRRPPSGTSVKVQRTTPSRSSRNWPNNWPCPVSIIRWSASVTS